MSKIQVRFSAQLPEEATTDQVQEWLDFNLIGGRMSSTNPLADHAIEAESFSVDFETE